MRKGTPVHQRHGHDVVCGFPANHVDAYNITSNVIRYTNDVVYVHMYYVEIKQTFLIERGGDCQLRALRSKVCRL